MIEIVEYVLNLFGAPVLAVQVNDYSTQLARVSSAACISATGITSRPDGNMANGLRQPRHCKTLDRKSQGLKNGKKERKGFYSDA